MRVITTAIPGSEEEQYLDRLVAYSEKRGKKIKRYSVGKMLLEQAQKRGVRLPKDKVLNANPHTLDERRNNVLDQIMDDMGKPANCGYSFIVNMHAWFYWGYNYKPAIDYYYLNELNPDLFITFLNDVDSIEKNLRARKQWNFLFSKDKYPGYGKEKILDWQSIEVNFTKTLAQHKRWQQGDPTKFFVVPSKATESIFYRLMFEQWRKIFYIGMPLTLFHDKKYAHARQRIDSLVEFIESLVIACDPRHVEPLSKKHLSVIDKPVYSNVVERDLYWLIPQTDGMIAFFPKIAYSSGVITEQKEVHETCGETILIYPPNKPASPFLTKWSDTIIRGEVPFKKEFLNYLGPKYLKLVKEAGKSYLKGAR